MPKNAVRLISYAFISIHQIANHKGRRPPEVRNDAAAYITKKWFDVMLAARWHALDEDQRGQGGDTTHGRREVLAARSVRRCRSRGCGGRRRAGRGAGGRGRSRAGLKRRVAVAGDARGGSSTACCS